MADPNPTPTTETIKFWNVEIPTSEHWTIKTLALLLATLVLLVAAVVVAHSGANVLDLLRLLLM